MRERHGGNEHQLFGKAIAELHKNGSVDTSDDERHVRVLNGYNRTGREKEKGLYTFVQETIQEEEDTQKRYILVQETSSGPIPAHGVIFGKGREPEFVGYEGEDSLSGRRRFMKRLFQGFLESDQFAKPHDREHDYVSHPTRDTIGEIAGFQQGEQNIPLAEKVE